MSVDKSEMLLYLNSVAKTKQKYVSVSRPRRFGKTMAADMICAYYDRMADRRLSIPDSPKRRYGACAGGMDGITTVFVNGMTA